MGIFAVGHAYAQDDTPSLPNQSWSFSGLFGGLDEAAAQRGFLVYLNVCSNCHSMHQLHYRDLAGIGLTAAEIVSIAASVTVPIGLNSQGEPATGPGTPASSLFPPFPNDEAARAAMNGALPPDLSLIVNAREGNADYVYRHPDRVCGGTGRVHSSAGEILQHLFPRSPDRHAAAAERRGRDLC